MTKEENDLWSDIHNPNNEASMDDWSDAHNPNNDSYLDDDLDEEEYYPLPAIESFKLRQKIKKIYEGFSGVIEKNEAGQWFVILIKDDQSIISECYDSAEKCIYEVEKSYDGCNVDYMTITINISSEPSKLANYYSALGTLMRTIK